MAYGGATAVMSMTSGLGRIIIAQFLLAIAATSAAACQGAKLLFEDKFTSADPTWGPQSDQFKIADGKAVVQPPGGSSFSVWNLGYVFGDADICYDVTLLHQASDPTLTFGGLMFWVADNQNYYAFETTSNGYFKVARYVGGKWATDPIGWTTSPALKQGANATNSVHVKLVGNSVTAEINGQPATSFHAQPPDKPSAVGLIAVSGSARDPWAFSHLNVMSAR